MRIIRAACVIQLVCALLFSNGCTSLHRAPLLNAAPQPPAWRIGPGDNVRVTMRDGQRDKFTVKAVDADGIVADDGTRYATADIVTVERREFSGPKTTLLVAGIGVGVFFVAVAVAIRSAFGR